MRSRFASRLIVSIVVVGLLAAATVWEPPALGAPVGQSQDSGAVPASSGGKAAGGIGQGIAADAPPRAASEDADGTAFPELPRLPEPPVPTDPSAPVSSAPPTVRPTISGRVDEGGLRAAAPNDFQIYRNRALTTTAAANNVRNTTHEPTVANIGRTVFYNGNSYAALSTDGGNSFKFVDPTTTFPNDWGGFCCDQLALYNAPNDVFVWVLQYWRDASGNNGVRVAVPLEGGQAGLQKLSFWYVDFTAQDFGQPNNRWIDRPQAEFSAGQFYLKFTIFDNASPNPNQVDQIMLRISLAQLRARPGQIGYQFIGGNALGVNNLSLPASQRASGAGTTMYFAGHLTTATLRLFRWGDAENQVFQNDISHRQYPNTASGNFQCRGPDNANACGFHDSRILAAWVAGGFIGFGWVSSQGNNGHGNFTFPFVQMVRIREADRTLVDEPIIWNDQHAWIYPAVGVNARGHLAITATATGGPLNPIPNVWLYDDINFFPDGSPALAIRGSTNGPFDNRWGDYYWVRPDSGNGNSWVGTGLTFQGACTTTNPAGATILRNPCPNVEPRFVWFGRERDRPYLGLSIRDLLRFRRIFEGETSRLVAVGLTERAAFGESLIYRLAVANNGAGAATGTRLRFTLPEGADFVAATIGSGQSSEQPCSRLVSIVTCDLQTLAAGAGSEAYLEFRPLVGGQNFSTVVDLIADEAAEDPAAETAALDTPVAPGADLVLTVVDGPDPVGSGGGLTYTATVTNSGPNHATGVTLTDVLPAGVTFQSASASQGSCAQGSGTVTCSLGNLANGASATATIVGQATTAARIDNPVSVIAAEADLDTSNNSATAITNRGTVPDLSLSMTDSPRPALVGGNLTYTAVVTNNGPNQATGVSVRDNLPADVTFVSASASQGGCVGPNIVICNLGTLANAASATVTIVVRPTAPTPALNGLFNSATVTGSVAGDPDTNDNSDSVTSIVRTSADLAVTVSDAPDPVAAGGTLTYTVQATNNGPSSATGVTLIDTLPGGVTFLSATPSQGTCSQANGIVTCNLGSLAGAATATVQIAVQAPAAPTTGTVATLTNRASVSAVEPDSNLDNNAATTTTNDVSARDLAVTIVDRPDPAAVGSNLTYLIAVTNTGRNGVNNVTLSDPLPVGAQFVSATPSQGSCSQEGGTVTCNLDSLTAGGSAVALVVVRPTTAGSLSNTVRVASDQPDPNAANDTAIATTTVNATAGAAADLGVTAAATPERAVTGTNLTYTLRVNNGGPGQATGVTLLDTLPAGASFVSAAPSQGTCSATGQLLSCELGTLANGASATVTLVVNVFSRADPANQVDRFSVTNAALVIAGVVDPGPTNNVAITTTPFNTTARREADLSLTLAGSQPVVGSNSQLTYTLTVANAGPNEAPGVLLVNPLPTGTTFVSATPTQGACAQAGGTVRCELGNLASGAQATVSLVIRTGAIGSLANKATVSTTGVDVRRSNDEATMSTTVADRCAPRPDVQVTATPDGSGRLRIFVRSQTSGATTSNRLRELRFGATTNAVIDAGSQVGQPGGFSVPLPDGLPETSFVLRRVTTGQAAQVQFVAVDECGDWPTFAGGGPNAF